MPVSESCDGTATVPMPSGTAPCALPEPLHFCCREDVGIGWRSICGIVTLVSLNLEPDFLEFGGGMWDPWKRMGERRWHMGKAARMCEDC